MCLVRSTYLPNGSTRVVEAKLQSPFTEGGTLLFEPDPGSKWDGVEMPEVLVKQQSNGRVLLVIENHSTLSSYHKAGRCVGTYTTIEDASVHDVTTTEQKGGTPPIDEKGEVYPPHSPSGVSDISNTKGISPPHPQSGDLDYADTERLQQLF